MWVRTLEELGLQEADPIYKLVSNTGPLSDILQTKCKQLSVQVVSQHIENDGFIREVYLHGDGIPLVNAITTAPLETYLKFKTEFDNLGNNLLGKTLLYSRQHLRSAFAYAIIDGYVARKSTFSLENYKVYIQEKFVNPEFLSIKSQ
jgi:chorismate-pyruvate lyase